MVTDNSVFAQSFHDSTCLRQKSEANQSYQEGGAIQIIVTEQVSLPKLVT